MKHETVLKKVEKRLGVKAEEGYNGKWFAQHDDHIISWYAQKNWQDPDGPLEAQNFHVRRVDDISDIQTDYFAGYHLDNATQMINSVCPPAAKFPVGCLVRGKDNKRATRQGYAGKTGIVTKLGPFPTVNWLGEEPSPYNNYPERDLELVSAA
jgi:hypothetical protein